MTLSTSILGIEFGIGDNGLRDVKLRSKSPLFLQRAPRYIACFLVLSFSSFLGGTTGINLKEHLLVLPSDVVGPSLIGLFGTG